MDLELIVAFNKINVIGKNNSIPWYIPEDLKHFRETTKNNIIVMGRKTFESFPNGPLKNRIHVVITNQKKENETSIFYSNFEDSFLLLDNLQKETNKKIFIIGGNTIYQQYFEHCNRFHITYINNTMNGDVLFPYNIEHFKHNYNLIAENSFINNKECIVYLFEKINLLPQNVVL